MTTIEPSETGGPQRPPALAAWWAMTFAVTGAVLAVFAVVWHPPRSPSFDVLRAIEICAFLAFALLGALLVWRRPDHPVGWLLAALGVAVLVQQSAQQYALRGLAAPFQLHGWQLASWVAQWTIAPPLVLFVEVLLLFPAGRPNSRVQRVYVWGVGVAGVVLTIGWAAATWSQRGAALLTGGGALPGVLGTLRLALIASLLVAAGSLIWRFRYADPDERQQLKWLLLAGCGLMVAAAAGLITTALGTSSRLVDALGVVSIGGVAAAMTLAVLRYRLYEIDHILSRTVSYSLLTAILTALYTLGVVTVRAVLDPLSPDSGLAVAASTPPRTSTRVHQCHRSWSSDRHRAGT